MEPTSSLTLRERLLAVLLTGDAQVFRHPQIEMTIALQRASFAQPGHVESSFQIEVPPDPLGALDRIANDDGRVFWTGGLVVYKNTCRWSGVFAGSDSVMIEQPGAPNRRFPQMWITSGSTTLKLGPDVHFDQRAGPSVWADFPYTVPSPAALSAADSVATTLGMEPGPWNWSEDRLGRRFRRWESGPQDAHAERPLGLAAHLLLFPVQHSSFCVDIWADDAGGVNHLRLLSSDGARWTELSFLREVATLPDLPASPLSIDEPMRPEWVGWEEFEPSTPVGLRVALDRDGRPYDIVPNPDVSIRGDHLGNLHTSDGRIVVMDGNGMEIDMVGFGPGTIVDFEEPTEVDVTVIREVYPAGESILGIRLDRPDTSVARWGALETAYVTDGGVGAITTSDVIAEATRRSDTSLSERLNSESEAMEWPTDLIFTELLDTGRPETIYFRNGSGDGGFPLTRGFDEDGTLVAAFVFDNRYPFRLAIPDGLPPPEITQREEQFIECMQGERPILPNGGCPTDDQLAGE